MQKSQSLLPTNASAAWQHIAASVSKHRRQWAVCGAELEAMHSLQLRAANCPPVRYCASLSAAGAGRARLELDF